MSQESDTQPPDAAPSAANPLKRIGWLLIGVGTVDVCVMAWCISHRQGYSSSFNLFAVIGGILALRGKPKLAAFEVSMAAVLVPASIIACLYLVTDKRLAHAAAVTMHAGLPGILLMSVVYIGLGALVIVARRREAWASLEGSWWFPKVDVLLIVGVLLGGALVAFIHTWRHSDATHQIEAFAIKARPGARDAVLIGQSARNGDHVDQVLIEDASGAMTCAVRWHAGVGVDGKLDCQSPSR